MPRRATVPTGSRSIARSTVAGIVLIGLVTAFGLHAANLPPLVKNTGSAFGKVLNTAEVG